jgi:membrane fusion protein (multidrug efflux system)
MKTVAMCDTPNSPSAAEAAQSPRNDVPAPNAAGDPPRPAEPGAMPTTAASRWQRYRKWLLWASAAVAIPMAGKLVVSWADAALNTVSTDDAYVNGHVTMVAPRVPGEVVKVLVDDNMRVKKGDVLVQLDKEPYLVQVALKKAALASAEADLEAARAQVRSQVAAAGADLSKLRRAMEDVNTQIANLRAAVATLNSRQAALVLARERLKRGKELAPRGTLAKEELDERRQTFQMAEAAVDQGYQQIFAIRVGLGLPAQPATGKDLTDVPPNLDQDFSGVREILGRLRQSAAQFGYFVKSWDAPPKQTLEEFYQQHPKGDLDAIIAKLLPTAPLVRQAEAKLHQTRHDLEQAELNLRYCDIVSEIDGVVTSRNINPGNNVQPGQSLMAVRSVTEIWIDASFKETQLADLRIGQRAKIEVDMYGSRREFEGRITGFTMGTGQTLALLPPQNATGNFVKIVQRLPVRIELTDYDPAAAPLFIGLSVTPYVYFKEPATGPHAGEFLQPPAALPKRSQRPDVKGQK